MSSLDPFASDLPGLPETPAEIAAIFTGDFARDLSFAWHLADAADAVSVPHFSGMHGDLHVRLKPDQSEVTDADLATERTIRQLINTHLPQDNILGEEFGITNAEPGQPNHSDTTAAATADGSLSETAKATPDTTATSKRTWIIDPIDGTGNYLRGVPIWATLISLAVDGVPMVSVVSAPLLSRRWWAAPGAGSWMQLSNAAPRKLQVSAITELSESFVSTGSLDQWDSIAKRAEAISLLDSSHRHRMFGDFLPYMLLAEGAVDVVTEPDLKPYDIAALVPVVVEAGGRFGSISGDAADATHGIWDGSALAAATASLYDQTSAILNG